MRNQVRSAKTAGSYTEILNRETTFIIRDDIFTINPGVIAKEIEGMIRDYAFHGDRSDGKSPLLRYDTGKGMVEISLVCMGVDTEVRSKAIKQYSEKEIKAAKLIMGFDNDLERGFQEKK